MNVFDLKDPDGGVFAFQVDNTFLGRRGVCKLLARIPGCRILKGPGFLSWFWQEQFCQFKIGDVAFVVWEPYGDNDQYWIGPEQARWVPEIAVVRQVFIDEPGIPPWVRAGMVLLFVAMACAMLWGLVSGRIYR